MKALAYLVLFTALGYSFGVIAQTSEQTGDVAVEDAVVNEPAVNEPAISPAYAGVLAALAAETLDRAQADNRDLQHAIETRDFNGYKSELKARLDRNEASFSSSTQTTELDRSLIGSCAIAASELRWVGVYYFELKAPNYFRDHQRAAKNALRSCECTVQHPPDVKVIEAVRSTEHSPTGPAAEAAFKPVEKYLALCQ